MFVFFAGDSTALSVFFLRGHNSRDSTACPSFGSAGDCYSVDFTSGFASAVALITSASGSGEGGCSSVEFTSASGAGASGLLQLQAVLMLALPLLLLPPRLIVIVQYMLLSLSLLVSLHLLIGLR